MTTDRTPGEPGDDRTESESYREERGRPPGDDPRDRMARVPLAFGQGGVLEGHFTEEPLPAGGDSDAAADVAAARERQARADEPHGRADRDAPPADRPAD